MRRDGSRGSPAALSLAAEMLLFAVEPLEKGLVPHNRLRFRRALAAAHGSGYPGAGWRARRAARRELRRAGLISAGRLELADRPRARARFREFCRCLEDPEAADARAWELLLLLAWSGVLAARLGKEERRMAERRLRALFRTAGADRWGIAGAEHPLPTWLPRLGGIEEVASEIDLFDSPELLEFGTDHSGLR